VLHKGYIVVIETDELIRDCSKAGLGMPDMPSSSGITRSARARMSHAW